MKYTTIIGLLLIGIGVTAYFFGNLDVVELIKNKEFLAGILFGGGTGVLLGGFIGWAYKKRHVIEKQTKQTQDSTATEL